MPHLESIGNKTSNAALDMPISDFVNQTKKGTFIHFGAQLGSKQGDEQHSLLIIRHIQRVWNGTLNAAFQSR